MVGFKFDEVMSGTHKFESQNEEFEMEFRVRWGPTDIIKWAENKFTCPLEGVITIGKMCKNVPCKGTISLHYWKGILKYDMWFTHCDVIYHYVGEKRNIRPWNLHKTHTTCYGVLTRAWNREVISKSVTHFRLKTLPAFLASFRIT